MIAFIDIPNKRERSDYTDCVQHLVTKISGDKEVAAIYHFGNVTTPGISDIDMLVVFRDQVHDALQPFDGFPERFNGLFTHGIDAVSLQHFGHLNAYSVLGNMHLVYGSVNQKANIQLSAEDQKILHTQVALEFLLINYIDLVMQLQYGIVKLRAFLQHTKGLLFDLQLLGIQSGELYDKVMELRERIRQWWTVEFSAGEFSKWIIKFYQVYHQFIQTAFNGTHFYVPPMKNYTYLKNVSIEDGKPVSWKLSGITLPNAFSFLGRKYFNLQRRLNHYTFQFPLCSSGMPEVLIKRYQFFEEMKKYNHNHFPYFDSLTTGFKLREK